MSQNETVGRSFDELQKKIKEFNSEIKASQPELRALDRALKVDPTNVDLVNRKFEIMSGQLQSNQGKVTALRGRMDELNQSLKDGLITQAEYDKQMQSLEQQTRLTEIEVTRLNAALKQKNQNISQAQFGGIQAGLKGTQVAAQNLQKTMLTMNATLGLMGLLTSDMPERMRPMISMLKILTAAVGAAAVAFAIKKGTMTLGAAVPGMLAAAGAAAAGIRGLIPRTDDVGVANVPMSTSNVNVPNVTTTTRVTQSANQLHNTEVAMYRAFMRAINNSRLNQKQFIGTAEVDGQEFARIIFESMADENTALGNPLGAN